MHTKQTLLFVIYYLNIIFCDEIGILFTNTILLDNSTINWNNFNTDTSCFLSTTININQTLFTTIDTEQNDIIISTTTGIQIIVSTTIQSTASYTCVDGSYGVNCNISSAVCDITNPCLNEAICHSNNTLSLGYYCQCPSGFSDYDCETDNRICKDNTCWNNGTCIEVNETISGDNQTSAICQCIEGYEGTNCQLESDMCENITCENGGSCISAYLTWSCECLSFYSGIYCQDKSSTLTTKEALSKSFAIIAIIALCCVVAFVIIMDVLKYVFNIDPVDRERHRLRMEQEKEDQKRFRKKKLSKKKIEKIKIIDFATRFSAV